MALVYYRALIMQDEGETPQDGYGVVFPDLPGCTSAGDTPMESAKLAAEALAGYVAATADAGELLPDPSDIGTALPDWLEDSGRVTAEVLVPVEIPGRAVRANITVDEGLLHRIDTAARAMGNTRSGFLAEAARAWFREERTEWAEKRAKDLHRQLELLRTGKMRSVENHGQGEVDTTAASIERIEGWLSELDGVVRQLAPDAVEAS